MVPEQITQAEEEEKLPEGILAKGIMPGKWTLEYVTPGGLSLVADPTIVGNRKCPLHTTILLIREGDMVKDPKKGHGLAYKFAAPKTHMIHMLLGEPPR